MSKDMKIAICFGLIMGALISICNMCFAAEKEDFEFQVLDNATIMPNGYINSSSSVDVYYFEIEEGYEYYFTPKYTRTVGFSDNTPVVGLVLADVSTLPGGVTYTFSGRDTRYVFVATIDDVGEPGELQRRKLEGMTDFVDNISFALSVDNLSSVWAYVVPIIAISILFGLGFYLLKRLLNKIKRAKGGA